MCPDGVIRTGKPLKDAVRQYSIELLEPAKAIAEPVQSADEFLREHPELRDTRSPQPLKQRLEREFMSFLKSDVGRAWHKRMTEYGHLDKSIVRIEEYMEQHKMQYNQKGFALAAVAVADEISVTLDQADIGGARVSNTFIHDGGGSHHAQLPMGATMAGQFSANPYNPNKSWTEAEVRRELNRMNANELELRLRDKAFVEALNKFGLLRRASLAALSIPVNRRFHDPRHPLAPTCRRTAFHWRNARVLASTREEKNQRTNTKGKTR